MDQNKLKKQVAIAALDYVVPGEVIGIGTGSTVNFFIDELAKIKHKVEAAVSSSVASADRLASYGIPVIDLNQVGTLSLYVDGADETNQYQHLIKGGGGALTREKIIAAASKQFVCVVDQSKVVEVLGKFPLPVEVIPMARSFVARALIQLGSNPVFREGFITDNGNEILDVHNMEILDPVKTEETINHITGVVTNGLFAKRPSDVLLIASPEGVKTIKSSIK